MTSLVPPSNLAATGQPLRQPKLAALAKDGHSPCFRAAATWQLSQTPLVAEFAFWLKLFPSHFLNF
jgi:hypothetical protein